jgi:hypothetical protein
MFDAAETGSLNEAERLNGWNVATTDLAVINLLLILTF